MYFFAGEQDADEIGVAGDANPQTGVNWHEPLTLLSAATSPNSRVVDYGFRYLAVQAMYRDDSPAQVRLRLIRSINSYRDLDGELGFLHGVYETDPLEFLFDGGRRHFDICC